MLHLIRYSKKIIPSSTSNTTSKLFFTTSINNNNNSSNNRSSPQRNSHNNYNNNYNNKSRDQNQQQQQQHQNQQLNNNPSKIQIFIERLHPKVKKRYSSIIEKDKKKKEYLNQISSLLYGVEESKPTFYLFDSIVENENHSIDTVKFLFDSINFDGKNSSALNFLFEQFVNYYLSQIKAAPTPTSEHQSKDSIVNNNNNSSSDSNSSISNSNKKEKELNEIRDYINKIKTIVDSDDKVYFNSGFYNNLLRFYIGIDSREGMKKVAQKIILSQNIQDYKTISLLVVAFLRTDNVTSAASLYNKLLSSSNLSIFDAFNEFLNYYLSKGTVESTDLAIKLFFRNLNSVPIFLNTNYFLEFIEKVFQVSGKSTTNEILDVITKKVYSPAVFLNISLHLVKQINNNNNNNNSNNSNSNNSDINNSSNYYYNKNNSNIIEINKQDYLDISKEIYYERVKKFKGVPGEDLTVKQILWCILSNEIGELESLLEKSKSKLDIHITQRLLEFINYEHSELDQEVRDKLNNLTLKYSNSNSLYLVIVYNQLKKNKKLLNLVEEFALVKSAKNVMHHTLNFIIQTYLALDYYHLAMNWFAKKVSVYNSSPSIQIYKSFLQYHKEVYKSTQGQFLENFWNYKVLNDNYDLIKLKEQQQQQQGNNNQLEDNSNMASTSVSKSQNLKIKIVTKTKEESSGDSNKIQSIKEKKTQISTKWKLFEQLLDRPLMYSSIKDLKLLPPQFTEHPLIMNCLKNDDISQIDILIEKLLESFEDDQNYKFTSPRLLSPNNYNVIKAYSLIEKNNLQKYIELLGRSPKYIRAIVFSPEAYNRIFEYDFKVGIELLKSEPQGIQQSLWIFESILQYLIKHDHADLASLVIGRMLVLEKQISYGEEFLKLIIKKDDYQSKAIIGPLSEYMIKNSKMSPSIANIEIIKLLDLGLVDEALEIFNMAPKNQDSIILGLRIYSKKYPIPPISNLMYWGSLSEIEKSVDPNGRVFFEQFYRVLYEHNLSHIIKLYGDKSNSIKYASPLELHYLLLAEKDDQSRLDLFNRYPLGKPILQETYDNIKLNLEYLPNLATKQKLESTSITSLSKNTNYIQLDKDTIQFIVENYSNYKSTVHDLAIINNENDLRIIIKDKVNNDQQDIYNSDQ